jgi:hypothetical protein
MSNKTKLLMVFSVLIALGVVVTRWAVVRIDEARETLVEAVENSGVMGVSPERKKTRRAVHEFMRTVQDKAAKQGDDSAVLDAGEDKDLARWQKREQKRQERILRREKKLQEKAERDAASAPSST